VNDRWDRGEGFGVYVTYNPSELPRFVQWKQMGEQDYVVGFEPCNCGVEGRRVDEELGLLHCLEPGESHSFTLGFGPITEETDVNQLRVSSRTVRPEFRESYREFVKRPATR
jgi:hypothetical protein